MEDLEGGADDLHADPCLAPETAADVRGDDPDVLVGQPERGQSLRKHIALRVGRLRGRPQREPAGLIQFGYNHVRLDRTMGVAGHRVLVLEDHIGFGEPRVDVTVPDLPEMSNVGVFLGEEPR